MIDVNKAKAQQDGKKLQDGIDKSYPLEVSKAYLLNSLFLEAWKSIDFKNEVQRDWFDTN